MKFELKDGTPIIGSFYSGKIKKTGIGFIKLVGETWYAYLSLKDGGTTKQKLFSMIEYRRMSFGLDDKGNLIILE